MTFAFYIFAVVVGTSPLVFIGTIWHEARKRGWIWINEQSRNMYVDGVKTMIAGAGIAVALLASSAVSSVRTTNPIVASSAKVAVICLIGCVCISLVAIVALLRSYERAMSRYLEELRPQGNQSEISEGKLNVGELVFIVLPCGAALSCFLIGFAFLGRVAFQF